MSEISKRFEVRVFDERDSRGEFVEAYDTLEEAQKKVQELEANAKEIAESDSNERVKSHFCSLTWKIIDLAKA